MTVLSGRVDATVSVKGEGDAERVVDGTQQAFGRLQKAILGTEGVAGRAASGIQNLMKGASGIQSLMIQVAGVTGVVGAVAKAFEFAVPIVKGLWNLLASPTVDRHVEAMTRAVEAANKLATAHGGLARATSKAQDDMRSLKNELYEVAAANAEALGDLERAQELRAATKQLNAGEEVLKESALIQALSKEYNTLQEARWQNKLTLEELDRRERDLSRQLNAGKLSTEEVRDATANLAATRMTLVLQSAFMVTREKEINEQLAIRRQLLKELGTKAMIAGMPEEPKKEPAKPPRPAGGRPRETAEDRDRKHAKEMAEFHRALRFEFMAWEAQQEEEAHQRRLELAEKEDAERRAIEERSNREKYSAGFEDTRAGDAVRDFTGTLSDSLPELDRFNEALGITAARFSEVAAANDNLRAVRERYNAGLAESSELELAHAQAKKSMTTAVIGSVGALAKAGAEQIKNERARAGVMAIIETAMGFATLWTNPAESAAHFIAAATFGLAAMTGSGSKAASASQTPQRSIMAVDSGMGYAQGALTFNVYGGWYGNSTPQESAAAVADRFRALRGTGFEEGGAWAA